MPQFYQPNQIQRITQFEGSKVVPAKFGSVIQCTTTDARMLLTTRVVTKNRLNCYKPVRSLRSSDRLLLQVPNVSTAIYGQRTFSFCAPKLQNTLYLKLQNKLKLQPFLKRNLKRFFFVTISNFRFISQLVTQFTYSYIQVRLVMLRFYSQFIL